MTMKTIVAYVAILQLVTSIATKLGTSKSPVISDKFWNYNSPVLSYPTKIRYKDYDQNYYSKPVDQASGSNVLFLHGFGGNADQFRENMPFMLENGHKSYAMDLLGYGYSEKPDPKAYDVNYLYNFENWAHQTVNFVTEVVKEPTYLVCNSVGGVVGLQAAKISPNMIKGVILINISMRMLHVTKQPPLARPFIKLFQDVLRETPMGPIFFSLIAQREGLRNILRQAYADPKGIDDTILDVILKPGLLPGAAAVFLDFISYSGGPLPEQLLNEVKCPVRILWGEKDPWEPIEMGRKFASYECVDEFITLPGAGHCPMDQVPDMVNKEILEFLRAQTVVNI
mmetsp:Transcript_26574/g.26821  ORF Transcript_26574/g.26821 Transcript_26574/m.26821 type:complete len:340 (+) Transcript_26574:40-1059(+)